MKTHSIEVNVVGELKSKRDRNFPLQAALLELIDNSVDEGAFIINIREDGGDLIIEDNGLGFKDIASALVVAKSNKKGKIGRYGVGMKDACLKYSNATIIESNGKRFTAPWLEIMNEENPHLVQEESIETESLTRIVLCDFRQRYKSAIETKDIRRTYQKLIESEKLEITVTGTKLGKLQMPEFTKELNETFNYEGKRLCLTGGIYKSNDPARQDWKGYNPYYNGRLIGNGKITNHGTGDEGCTNFCFMLELLDDLDPWALSTNKDDVDGMDQLLDFIYHQYTQPLLKAGADQAIDVELKEIENIVNDSLNGGPSGNITRSPKTKKGEEKKESKAGSPKRKTNTATRSGDYSNGSGPIIRRATARFKFAHLGGDTIGDIQPQGKRIIITANLDNPFIAANRSNGSLIMFFAKISHSIHRESEKHDLLADQWTSSIMNSAGLELAFTENR